jgi:hypothetical protein
MPRRKVSEPLPKISESLMLNGAVCAQFKRCGKPNCRCSRGELHGPYYYRFMWYGGRVVKEYVRKSDVAETRKACARYRILQNKLLAGRQRYTQMIATLKSQLRGIEL